MITADKLKTAIECGLGPLVGPFETPELERLHDQWIEGWRLIREVQAEIERLVPTEAVA